MQQRSLSQNTAKCSDVLEARQRFRLETTKKFFSSLHENFNLYWLFGVIEYFYEIKFLSHPLFIRPAIAEQSTVSECMTLHKITKGTRQMDHENRGLPTTLRAQHRAQKTVAHGFLSVK
jgi:hypothetical protein